MKNIFTTDDVHPRDRFAYWHDVACKEIVFHDSRPAERSNFHGSLRGINFGSLSLMVHQSSAVTALRTTSWISKSESDDVILCRQLAGVSSFEQGGREIVLEAGHITLLDPMTPYAAHVGGDAGLMVGKFSRAELEARVGAVRGKSLLPLHKAALGGLLAKLMDTAAQGDVSPQEAAYLSRNAVDLVAVCVGAAGGGLSMGSQKVVKLLQVREAIESRLPDQNLSPADIAAVVGCTVRYANMLLAEQNTSVGRLIMSMRLEQCRRALLDRTSKGRTVTEIALGWGFKNVAHFSRAFKDEYGVAPSELRSQANLN